MLTLALSTLSTPWPLSGSVWGLVLLIGYRLVRTGWWPERYGETPRCAKCGYILLNNESGVCPECGMDLTTAFCMRLGERPRRPVQMVVGVLLGLLALGALGSVVFHTVEWYHFRPAGWLVRDLQSGNAGDVTRAWGELERRRKVSGSSYLSGDVEQKLIGVALAEQARPVLGPVGQELIDYLGETYLAGKLTKEQGDLFLGQTVVLTTLSVRPTAVLGERLDFFVQGQRRLPKIPGNANWRLSSELPLATLEDRSSPGGPISTTRPPGGRGGGSREGSGIESIMGSIYAGGNGKMTLETSTLVGISAGPLSHTMANNTLYVDRKFTLSAEVRVVGHVSELITMIDNPMLLPRIQQSIAIAQAKKSQDGARPSLLVEFKVDAPPINIAFDVFCREYGIDERIGSIAIGKGSQGTFTTDPGHGIAWSTSRIGLVLRSSDSVAHLAGDLTPIWKGEIVFENVEVGK